MIPSYPFSVRIDYRQTANRKPISKSFETLAMANAALQENIGKKDVLRVTITLIIEQMESWKNDRD